MPTLEVISGTSDRVLILDSDSGVVAEYDFIDETQNHDPIGDLGFHLPIRSLGEARRRSKQGLTLEIHTEDEFPIREGLCATDWTAQINVPAEDTEQLLSEVRSRLEAFLA